MMMAMEVAAQRSEKYHAILVKRNQQNRAAGLHLVAVT